MALPALDAFTGNNGDPLSANWTAQIGTWEISSNAADSITGNLPNMAWWDADSFTADHYAQAKIGTAATGGGVGVRLTSAGHGYYLRQAAGTSIELCRLDAGVETSLQTISGLTIANLDTLRLEVSGTTLKVYQNTVQRGTDQTDATYASGSAGIVSFGSGAPPIDDFEAGNLGGATAVLTGTALASIGEGDVVAGAETIIVTLTGTTFIAS